MRAGAYFPPPPLWSVATMDGDPVLKPFQINKTLSTNTEDEGAIFSHYFAAKHVCCFILIFQNNGTYYIHTTTYLITAAKEAAAAYQIHCNQMGGYLDGIQYTPYADEDTKHGSGGFIMVLYCIYIHVAKIS